MNARMKTLFFSAAAVCLLAVTAHNDAALAAKPSGNASPWKTIVVGNQSVSERLATADLQRYLAQVSGTLPTVEDVKSWKANPVPAVILGTPQTNPLLKSLGIKSHDQGYYLANEIIGKTRVVIAAGNTSAGATNAVYGLLKELDFGFYLGSEAIPDSLPDKLEKNPVARNPVFSVRGVLPWYNFFNSPTTWDPVDHRAFVDQLVRMGANFVGFHAYDGEPFAAYEENEKMVWGGRLLNTHAPTWGTNPLPTRGFAFGIDKLFADDYFGARTTIDIKDPAAAIRAEQDVMRDALDYARKRGLHTCIGFEVAGDPLNPTFRDVFLKRINHLLDRYPSLDYIWIWQPETQGAQGFRETYNMHMLPYKLDPASQLPLYGMARRDVFHRIVDETKGEAPYFQDNEEGKVARANEGARLEQFGMLAYRALSHRKNAPKLVISGWGGDERLCSADYYDGLDKLLPKDVVFSSLDHIAPRERVDRVYGVLPKSRERWPIPWLENDGDQWHPQPYVHIFEKTARDMQAGGSQGVLGIHWRTRDLDENFAFLTQYAWEPGLTAEEFFKDYAHRCYNPAIADEMAGIHSKLDNLGYRWIGGGGQNECALFTWGPGEEAKTQALTKLRNEAADLLPKAKNSKTRLQWLIDNIDWVLDYGKAELDAVEAGKLLKQAKQASGEQAKNLAQSALDLLNNDDLAQALRTYTKRVTTRGEYGVLATINTKAVTAWRDTYNECLK